MKISRIPAKRENKKVRVAVYCRVSTKKEEQEDSLEEQQAAYTELISLRSDWQLVGVYATAFRSQRREGPGIQRMIDARWVGISTDPLQDVPLFRNVAECKKYADLLNTECCRGI